MSTFIVPGIEEEPWPSLGGEVCAWIEENLVHGPGDLRGQPVHLDEDQQLYIWRAYELYPQGHPSAGRRRFRRVALSLQKGSAKTELAALIAAAELHPEAPVRFDRWVNGEPRGRSVIDPYIPLVAYTEEQSEDLAYGALRVILELSRVSRDFDIGLERIMRIAGDGKAVALASAPDARDGARTTFQHKDESHRWTLPRLKLASRTMTANLPKRYIADPWELETTTAFSPGENSVAEDTWAYARSVAEGARDDSRLFFFHRQASEKHDLSTREGVKAAVIEAAGATAAWKDIDGIAEQFEDPTADRAYLERVWLNKPVQAGAQAFDVAQWDTLSEPATIVGPGEVITLGFDGSRYNDATALVATSVVTGHIWPLGIWERPLTADEWEVPEREVEAVIDDAFSTWKVWRFYADPYWWQSQVAAWSGKYGKDKVVAFDTTKYRQMAHALKGFLNALMAGELTHNGDAQLTRHIGNARKRLTNLNDEDGRRLWVIQKERPDSTQKIDGAMAAVLSWTARTHAVAAGAAEPPKPKWHGIYIPESEEEERSTIAWRPLR